jgi:hypothetical protein
MGGSCLPASDPVARLLTRLRFRARIGAVIFGAVMIHLTIGTYHTFGEGKSGKVGFHKRILLETVVIKNILY